MPAKSSPALSRREQSHERIIEAAARAIRRVGYDGVGVADVMKEAGLTHGGFYAHFDSRNALLAEAVRRAGRDGAARLDKRLQQGLDEGLSPLRILVDGYLSAGHLQGREQGCVVAALSSEIPRQSSELREASVERVQALIERVRQALPLGLGETQRHAQAMVIASTLVGALQLARGLGAEAGEPLLAETRRSLLARYETAATAPPA